MITHDLARFRDTLATYTSLSSKSIPEVIAKKGIDLRIQLYREFRKVAWKRGKKDGAMREANRRFRAGIGIRVRSNWRNQPTPDAPKTKSGRAMSRYQAAVWDEVRRRRVGVGILGVSLLDRRWRNPRSGRFLSANTSRKLGTLALFDQRPDRFAITVFTPGSGTVAERYGIASKALNAVSSDMDKYIARKYDDAAKKSFGKLIK